MSSVTEPGARLSGRKPTFARLVWIFITLLAIGVLIIATPVYYHHMITLSGPDIDHPEVLAANLANLGLSPAFFVNYFLAVGYFFALIYLVIAVLIFIRRSDERVALLFTLFLVIFGIIFTNIPTALETEGGLRQWSYRFLNYLSFALFIYAFHKSPLRRADQNGIDRRFYRQHYDATNILTAFEASMRDEVDLNALIERLLTATKETLHPTHASLWLRRSRDGSPAIFHNAAGNEVEAGVE